jgi:hypothetical protein
MRPEVEQKVELLLLGYGFLIIMYLFANTEVSIESQKCDTIHESAPRPELRCETKNDSEVDPYIFSNAFNR